MDTERVTKFVTRANSEGLHELAQRYSDLVDTFPPQAEQLASLVNSLGLLKFGEELWYEARDAAQIANGTLTEGEL